MTALPGAETLEAERQDGGDFTEALSRAHPVQVDRIRSGTSGLRHAPIRFQLLSGSEASD